MKINTKFGIGDEVHFIYNDKIQIGHVWSIRIGISGPNWISEEYTMQEHGGGEVLMLQDLSLISYSEQNKN